MYILVDPLVTSSITNILDNSIKSNVDIELLVIYLN